MNELFLIAELSGENSADSSNLLAARLQMAFTLGFHIVLASFGVGLPVLMIAAEWLGLRGNATCAELARRWSKSFAVLFAIGAVSGTVLSFELGLLWPEFMGRWGSVIGLPFTMEGFAFFIEAIFAGIYLYGWDRLSPRVHLLSGIPIAVSGFFSAWFVVTANAWMNSPQGFEIVNGKLSSIDPIAAMLNPATGAQTTHMILAAYMLSGFGVAAFYAWRMLRGDDSEYSRMAFRIGLMLAVIATPLQIASGDWAAKVVAKQQPVKFAAMEAHFETESGAALTVGGIPNHETGEVHYAIKLPKLLSFLAHGDFEAEVVGLEEFEREIHPPVTIVHLSFQVMVGIGMFLLAISLFTIGRLLLRKGFEQRRLFLWAVLIAGPLTAVALEAGWIVTEVGRQPWIVQGHMLTRDAVTEAEEVWWIFAVTLGIYAVLLVGLIVSLRYLAGRPRIGSGASRSVSLVSLRGVAPAGASPDGSEVSGDSGYVTY